MRCFRILTRTRVEGTREELCMLTHLTRCVRKANSSTRQCRFCDSHIVRFASHLLHQVASDSVVQQSHFIGTPSTAGCLLQTRQATPADIATVAFPALADLAPVAASSPSATSLQPA